MGTNRTLYTKYHEKMQRLINNADWGTFTFISDDVFNDFSRYFVKTINKEATFKLYRYIPLYRFEKSCADNKQFEKIFSLDLDKLWLSDNGLLNDIFEGLPNSDYDKHTVEECLNKLNEIGKIKCFSETNHNNLMWAHYGNGYRGICIEYDIKTINDPQILNAIFPVYYSKDRKLYASIDLIIEYLNGDKSFDPFQDAKGIFLQKSKDWKYEQEWRICYLNHKNNNISFPYVSAVYLGPRISSEDKTKVIEKTKEYEQKYNKIKIFETKLNDADYNLNFKEL